MREVIEKMLEIERRARRIVAKAEAQAVQMTDQAHQDARQAVEAARQEALAKVKPLVRQIVAEAEKQKEARLTEARERFEAEKQRFMSWVPAVAEKLFPLLLGTAGARTVTAPAAGAASPDQPQAAQPPPTDLSP